MRKDVAGYDLKSLLIGSEGTLGIVTAAWLRLIPAPEAAIPVAAVYPMWPAAARRSSACSEAACRRRRSSTWTAARSRSRPARFPAAMPAGAGFMVLAEADGRAAEARGDGR